MVAKTNLPATEINDSAARTKLFFDTYGETPLQFNATDVDAAITFFEKKGFGEEAALTTSSALLKQAKLENISIFSVLDELKGLGQIEISALVSEILNNNRPSTSTLGYRQSILSVSKQRNVVP
jgi:hypothetical protein